MIEVEETDLELLVDEALLRIGNLRAAFKSEAPLPTREQVREGIIQHLKGGDDEGQAD